MARSNPLTKMSIRPAAVRSAGCPSPARRAHLLATHAASVLPPVVRRVVEPERHHVEPARPGAGNDGIGDDDRAAHRRARRPSRRARRRRRRPAVRGSGGRRPIVTQVTAATPRRRPQRRSPCRAAPPGQGRRIRRRRREHHEQADGHLSRRGGREPKHQLGDTERKGDEYTDRDAVQAECVAEGQREQYAQDHRDATLNRAANRCPHGHLHDNECRQRSEHRVGHIRHERREPPRHPRRQRRLGHGGDLGRRRRCPRHRVRSALPQPPDSTAWTTVGVLRHTATRLRGHARRRPGRRQVEEVVGRGEEHLRLSRTHNATRAGCSFSGWRRVNATTVSSKPSAPRQRWPQVGTSCSTYASMGLSLPLTLSCGRSSAVVFEGSRR